MHPGLKKKICGTICWDLQISVKMQKHINCKLALPYKLKQKETQCNCQERCQRNRFQSWHLSELVQTSKRKKKIKHQREQRLHFHIWYDMVRWDTENKSSNKTQFKTEECGTWNGWVHAMTRELIKPKEKRAMFSRDTPQKIILEMKNRIESQSGNNRV